MLLFLSSDTYFDLCSPYLWVSENYVVNRSLYAVTRQLFVCVAAYGEELSEFSLSLNRHCSLALRVGNCTRANRYVDDSVYRLLHPCRGGGGVVATPVSLIRIRGLAWNSGILKHSRHEG